MIKELHVFDPFERQPAVRLTWWPQEAVSAKHRNLLLRLAQATAPVELEVDELLKGERVTLEVLWQPKEHPERQRALLRAAMLFSECNSNDGHIAWKRMAWTNSLVAENLAQAQIRNPWGPLHTRVRPRVADNCSKAAPVDVTAFKAYVEQELDGWLTEWSLSRFAAIKAQPTLWKESGWRLATGSRVRTEQTQNFGMLDGWHFKAFNQTKRQPKLPFCCCRG